ncbi:hypothetical protein PR002_g2348 [Phytophthora rubi]|uniref:Uncharacterized protein n=1 Tax=Phytophthora rubi TaxID=129364 RepID=A0A6A3NI56_9STRA|nr:hypothetical protein PR002_g2348 [Phytophthora rubi]
MNELHREVSAQDAEIRGLRLALSAQHDQVVPDQPQPYDASIEELFGDTTSVSSEGPDAREEHDDGDSGEDSEAEATDVSEAGATTSDEEEGDTDDESSSLSLSLTVISFELRLPCYYLPNFLPVSY